MKARCQATFPTLGLLLLHRRMLHLVLGCYRRFMSNYTPLPYGGDRSHGHLSNKVAAFRNLVTVNLHVNPRHGKGGTPCQKTLINPD